MSASKKNTTKSVTSSAAGTKTAASKPAALKTTAVVPTVRGTSKTPVAMLAPSPAPASKSETATGSRKPVAAPAASKALTTTITARVDIGFGNALFIRGEGVSLNWEKGLPMTNVGADLWQVSLKECARAYTFKFLVNDVTWSAGPDFTAACGTSVTLTPEF